MESVERARRHYNSKVESPQDARQCIAKRAQGPLIELKKFHNNIKRSLIKTFAGNKTTLLDVGCGRGGDLGKWIDGRVGYVRGIDVSDAEIDEARRRHFESYKKLACDFEVCATFGTEAYDSMTKYDCVTCMFALHFFFSDETTLDMFFRNVSMNLKEGGVLFGVTASGSRIHDANTKNKFVDIERLYETPEPFGSAYTCSIRDTVTSKSTESDGAIEYLVFENALRDSASKFGLVPLTFPNALHDFFEPSNGVLKHFKPRYMSTSHPDLSDASRLFAGFAFVRV
jgi:mRNA (guanine-N7-)-methyltransferase